MLRYLFARLWKNPLARYGSLAAVLLISFALIFSAREGLYRYFSRLFSSPDWSDVYRHSSRPFAFEENESRAQSLTASAWKDVYLLAAHQLPIEEPEKTVITAPLTTKPFAKFLNRNAEQAIFSLFNALATDCGTLLTSVELSDNTTALGEVAEASTPAGRQRRALRETIRQLLKIYTAGPESALQKKPDYLPAIELSNEIFRAGCSMRESATLYARALDYREYALQKQLYDADGGKLYNRNPEEFAARAAEAVQRDAHYRNLVDRYFQATKFRTPYDPAQLSNLREAYARLRSRESVDALVQALLAEARHNPAGTARKSHYDLYALDYPGLSDNPAYVYALAETAVLGHEFARASNIIGNALGSRKFTDEWQKREFERLRFWLGLQQHESETISRF